MGASCAKCGTPVSHAPRGPKPKDGSDRKVYCDAHKQKEPTATGIAARDERIRLAAAGLKRCSACKEIKALQDFSLRKTNPRGKTYEFPKSSCKSCDSKSRAAYASSLDQSAVYRRRKAWAEKKYGSREAYQRRFRAPSRARIRARNLAAGLTVDGKPRKGRRTIDPDIQQSRLAEQNARQAFDYWFKVRATDAQITAWFAGLGTPWKNPRLTEAEQYRLQYQLDPAFAAAEKARATAKRFRNPDYALLWAKDGTRWYRALRTADGSIDAETMRYLRSIPECCLCGDALGNDRNIDHLTPVAAGGRHAADNLLPAHGACNRRKRDKPLLPFLFPAAFQPRPAQ